MTTHHPESRDDLDDLLDALLSGADEDLRASLTAVLRTGAALRAIIGPDPHRTVSHLMPGKSPDLPDTSVLAHIVRLRAVIRQLLGRGFGPRHDRVVQMCLDDLHELQEKLEARGLSWEQANKHVNRVEDRLTKRLEITAPHQRIVQRALKDLGVLRISVKHLFEDSHEWREDLAPRG